METMATALPPPADWTVWSKNTMKLQIYDMITAKTMNKHLLVLLGLCLFSLGLCAQGNIPFNGIVTDASGKPVKNARVWVKSPRDYAQTDKQGRFGLTNVSATDTLHISVKKEAFLVPVAGKRSAIVRLTAANGSAEASEDKQLVDVGFGFVSRREHTGTSNYIAGDELRRSGQQDVLSALQGRVPGLQITGTGGYGGANQQVSMRGERSIMGASTPLFLIDGVVVPSFEGLNLNDVDYVEVMKEASTYGSNGANGAIVVHTKMMSVGK